MAEEVKKRVRRTKEQIAADLDTQISSIGEKITAYEGQIAEQKTACKEAIKKLKADIKEWKQAETLIANAESEIASIEEHLATYTVDVKAEITKLKGKVKELEKKKAEALTPKEPKMTELEKVLVDRGLDLKTAKATIRMYKKSGMDDAAIKKALNI